MTQTAFKSVARYEQLGTELTFVLTFKPVLAKYMELLSKYPGRHLEQPQERADMKQHKFHCSCERYLPTAEFMLTVHSRARNGWFN